MEELVMLELAWAAGFFDGEGSSHAQKRPGGNCQFHLEVHQKGREPLDRLQACLGGKVYVSKTRPGIYKWSVQSKADVERVLNILWPYLTNVKKNQALAMYEKEFNWGSDWVDDGT
jgi:hypothetical protein